MKAGNLHRLIHVVNKALVELGHPLPLPSLEPMCVIIHRIMSYQTRQFHTLRHIFGFIDDTTDAHTVLAAVFHDLVYFQVDDGIPPALRELCFESVVMREGQVYLRTDRSDDKLFALALHLFGFEGGRQLTPATGLNEFLSTFLFLRLMEDHVSVADLVAVAVCLEASIPFRGLNSQGQDVGQALATRLACLANPVVSPAESRAMVARAIEFANQDVKDFQRLEVGSFLKNTWRLLPETNPSLRFPGTFTIRDYRVALGKMLGFFRYLKAENIFHTAPGVKLDFEAATHRARINLRLACDYMEARLLGLSLLEAMALVTGGDAPLTLFMGDLPLEGESFDTMEKFLPPAPQPAWLDPADDLFLLLSVGRQEDSKFDLKNSPLATFLYCSLEPGQRADLVRSMTQFFAGTMWAEPFLELWPRNLRRAVFHACAQIVPTRKAELERWEGL